MNKISQLRGKYMNHWVAKTLVGVSIPVIIGGIVAWIGKVNANIDKTEEVHIILPRIEKHMERQERYNERQEKKLNEIGERTANIEGQLKRR